MQNWTMNKSFDFVHTLRTMSGLFVSAYRLTDNYFSLMLSDTLRILSCANCCLEISVIIWCIRFTTWVVNIWIWFSWVLLYKNHVDYSFIQCLIFLKSSTVICNVLSLLKARDCHISSFLKNWEQNRSVLSKLGSLWFVLGTSMQKGKPFKVDVTVKVYAW